MSETATIGVGATVMKPPDAAGAQPSGPGGRAFQALIAARGHRSLQTTTQLEAEPAVSIGRDPDASGNIMPLPYLNNIEQIPDVALGAARSAVGLVVASHPPAGLSNGDGTDSRSNANSLSAELRNISSSADGVLPRVQLSPGVEASLSMVPGSTTSAHASGTGGVVSAQAPFALYHARFAEGFSQQVTLLANNGVQQARISINPPELGPVELRIIVRSEEVTVHLASQIGAVRNALEDALPRLREQFEQSGMRLADSEVFNELPGRSGQHEQMRDEIAAEQWITEMESTAVVESEVLRSRQGFVDAYV